MAAFHREIEFQLKFQSSRRMDGMVDEQTCVSSDFMESNKVIPRYLCSREAHPHAAIEAREVAFSLILRRGQTSYSQ